MIVQHALMMMLIIEVAAPLASPDGLQISPVAVVPRPANVKSLPGEFRITHSTPVLVDPGNPEIRAVGEYLAELLGTSTDHKNPVRQNTGATDGSIVLTTIGADISRGDEGYELIVTPANVLLRAPQPRGLFLGVQTLRQLLPADDEGQSSDARRDTGQRLPCVRITDKPRYRWRGMLLDCCRHFMSKEFVKRYIDLLAYHKMNVLHWHLTEDQGWRIEIRRYPRLTEIGAWRGKGDARYGGFYSQADVREIVAYARSRYVTVVPEIEMPGHSLAALAAHPELSCTGGPFDVTTRWGVHEDVYCAGNEETFEFLQNVLLEVIELFPSEFIHVGGDECPKTRWRKCPKCQKRIKAEGLKDERELQSYFIQRIEKFLSSKGKRLIGWDEILEGGLAPNATVQSWRGMNGAIAAARAGHDVISSPTSHCYLDYAQARNPQEPQHMGFIDLETVYSFEPTPAQLTPAQARHILGAEGNMWTEHAPQDRVDHQVFPRLCAIAEVTWAPPKLRNWADFSRRMQTHYLRLDALGVKYFLEPPRCISRDMVFSESLEVVLGNPLGRGEVRYTVDGGDPTLASPKYAGSFPIAETTTVTARTFLPDERSSDAAAFHFVKQSPREPVDVSGLLPGLSYEYYEGIWDRLPDFANLTPEATGNVPSVDISVRKRDDHFAVRFTGYIQVPADGLYTFYLTSDDGSKLWIGSDVVVDHDGLHSESTREGQVILRRGWHAITIAAFEGGGSQVLQASYSGPGIPRQPIPAAVLQR